MDVPGFRSALQTHFEGQRLGVPVLQDRLPVSGKGLVSIDEYNYEWEPQAMPLRRGGGFRGSLLQAVRIYIPNQFSTVQKAETEAHRVASLLVEASVTLTFEGLNLLVPVRVVREEGWGEDSRSVRLRLDFDAVTYGPALLGPTTTTLQP